jgi:phospholipid-binding lipoprotein MlaA
MMYHCSITYLSRAALLIGVLAISGCASVSSRNVTHDPFEGMNRISHGVNRVVDAVALRPASVIYDHIMPKPVVRGISNFSGNLGQPVSMVNSILQGRLSEASLTLFRFLANTTFGLGGLLDPATDMGLISSSTGFGETLHVWGFGEGAYLVIPLGGPTTMRDYIAGTGSGFLNPMRLITWTPGQSIMFRDVGVANLLGGRAASTSMIDAVFYESVDSYVETRSIYLQSRRLQLGSVAANDLYAIGLDPFDDPFDDPFIEPVAR